MTDEPTCTYCGHPRGVHPQGKRCFNDTRTFDGGWRLCTCSGYRAPEESE